MARGKKVVKELSPEERLEQALVPVDEQPYPIPENWCWVRLDKLYEINPKVTADDTLLVSFVPMERIEAGMTGRFTFETQPWGKARKNHTQFADGDVAFAKISPCFENQKSMMVQGLTNGIGGGTTELIILRQALMNQKYTFLLVSTEDFISRGSATYSGTVGQQRISMDFVKEYPVPVPPFSEQHRIVDRIERLFSKLDEAKERAQAVVDGFELRKSAILHKAFTGELTERWRKEHGVHLSDWASTTLAEIVSGFKYGTSEKSTYDNTGMPVLRIPNVGAGILDFEDMKYLEHNDVDETNQVHENDILIIRSNGSRDLVGKCAIVPALDGKFSYASFLIRISPSERVLPNYLAVYLNSTDARTQMFKKAKSSAGIHNINSQELGSITINVPTIYEQSAIINVLNNLLAKEQQTKEAAETVLDQIDTMKKAILARAFRGELGTNDPTEEWAGELLKTIL